MAALPEGVEMKGKSGALHRRVTILALMVGALLGAIAIPAAASTDGQHVIVAHKYSTSATQKFTFAKISSHATPHSAIGPNDTPPSGGCTATVAENVTGNYEDGVLADTVSQYSGAIHCTSSDPDQTMQYMRDLAQLRKDGDVISQADLDQCNHQVPTDSPCVNLLSANTGYCIEALACVGDYSTEMNYAELLPDGWVWTSWPDTCSNSPGNQEIDCDINTGAIYVAPNH